MHKFCWAIHRSTEKNPSVHSARVHLVPNNQPIISPNQFGCSGQAAGFPPVDAFSSMEAMSFAYNFPNAYTRCLPPLRWFVECKGYWCFRKLSQHGAARAALQAPRQAGAVPAGPVGAEHAGVLLCQPGMGVYARVDWFLRWLMVGFNFPSITPQFQPFGLLGVGSYYREGFQSGGGGAQTPFLFFSFFCVCVVVFWVVFFCNFKIFS